jgi:15-cis-phytoene synthase
MSSAEPFHDTQLGSIAKLVRRHDPDRFFTALFAPPECRDALLLLYAFNHELARAREATREPMLALTRLQWWPEIAQSARRRHEIAGPLGEALDCGRIAAGDLLTMIDGREIEAEPSMPTLPRWLDYVQATAGNLAIAAGRVLDVRALGGQGAGEVMLGRLRDLGGAYGVAGQLRNVPALARSGRCMLPEDTLGAHGLTVHAVIADPLSPRLRPALEELAAKGREMLGRGHGAVPRRLIAAALPTVLARRDLRRVGRRPGPRGFADRLAIVTAAMRGSV